MATLVNDFANAEAPDFAQYALTATATRISTLLLAGTFTCQKLTIKNSDSAANICYLGKSDVTNVPVDAGVELGAGDSITFNRVSPGQVWIVGTVAAANIVFIAAEY